MMLFVFNRNPEFRSQNPEEAGEIHIFTKNVHLIFFIKFNHFRILTNN